MTEKRHNESPTLFIPERSRQEWGIALLLFAFSVLFLWPFRDFTILFADEGIILQGAQRILRGQVLYRDFFTFYTPGSYYWTALRFKIFGSSLFVGRAILLVYGGIFSVAIYMLARRVCSRGIAALTAYLVLVIGLPYRFLVLHNWDSTVLAVLALYAAVRWAESSHRAWALATGTLVSLTCFFEQSKGVGLVVGLGMGFLLIAWYARHPSLFSRANLVALLAGLTWPAVLTLVYFASQHSLYPMIEDWLWPLRNYSLANRIPYAYIPLSFEGWETLYGSGSVLRRLFFISLTSPFFVVPFLPAPALALLIHVTYRMRRETFSSATNSYYILVCACGIGLVMGTVATGRPDVDHLLYVSPPLLLVVGWVLEGRLVRSSLLARAQPLFVVFFLITFTAFGMIFLVSGPLNARQKIETRRGPIKLPCCDAVIPYLQSRIPPGQKIFVYPYQPLYYFFTDTYSPTGFDYLQLGMHTPEQMAQTIADLETQGTATVVYAPVFNSSVIIHAWPSTPQQALNADAVRDFIFSRYRPCRTLLSLDWSYVVMRRRELPCPADSGDSGQAPTH